MQMMIEKGEAMAFKDVSNYSNFIGCSTDFMALIKS